MSYEHLTAQHIASFSFHNSRTQSHIGLISASNKDIAIYDANESRVIHTINDPSFKHAHTVKYYTGSYCRGDPDSLNTFLTASADNTILLWDLRVAFKAVREFIGGHQNRSQ